MNLLAKSDLKSRVMAVLMALVLMFGFSGNLASAFSVKAYAVEAAGTNIFDVIGDTGNVVDGGGGFETNTDTTQSIATGISIQKRTSSSHTRILISKT